MRAIMPTAPAIRKSRNGNLAGVAPMVPAPAATGLSGLIIAPTAKKIKSNQ
jgi:hypothetical protein